MSLLNAKRYTATERNMAPDSYSYRPFIQLDCVMTNKLVTGGEFVGKPLVIGDAGVRSGFDPLWNIFADQCVMIGFDPDKEECISLENRYKRARSEKSPDIHIENIALWGRNGKLNYYVTRDPNTSSCYLPNKNFFQRLPDSSSVDVQNIVKMPAITLDKYHERKGMDFDVLKIDVQGGELEILKGAVRQLDNSILAVIAEVEFVELYKGQALFSDIDSFMRKHGFALFDLDIRRWRRKLLPEEFDGIRIGQTIYADALFMWDPFAQNGLEEISVSKTSKLLKLASLAECFSLPDFAIEILSVAEKSGLIDNLKEEELVELIRSNRIIAQYDRNRII